MERAGSRWRLGLRGGLRLLAFEERAGTRMVSASFSFPFTGIDAMLWALIGVLMLRLDRSFAEAETFV